MQRREQRRREEKGLITNQVKPRGGGRYRRRGDQGGREGGRELGEKGCKREDSLWSQAGVWFWVWVSPRRVCLDFVLMSSSLPHHVPVSLSCVSDERQEAGGERWHIYFLVLSVIVVDSHLLGLLEGRRGWVGLELGFAGASWARPYLIGLDT